MTDEGFLRAILEEPDDDTHRLVYADWLDENGQPEHAEFIRVQIELARMDVEGRGSHARYRLGDLLECEVAQMDADAARRAQLEAREAVLLEEFERRWTPQLPRTRALRWWGRPARGFQEGVVVASGDVFRRAAPTLFRTAPIRLIHFERLGEREARALAGSEHLARVTGLQLPADVTPGAVRALLDSGALANLRTLQLWGSQHGERIARALAGAASLSNLRGLLLAGNHIGDAAALELIGAPHLVGLTSLCLRGNQLTDRTATALADSTRLTRLTELDLSCNALDDAGGLALAAASLGRLRTLVLTDNSIGARGLSALVAGQHFFHLRELYLSANGARDLRGSVLAACDRPPGLEVLSLGNNRIGPSGGVALAGCPALAKLGRLELYGCDLGDEGAHALAASPHLRGLVTLHLGSNAIQTEGATALAGSPNLARVHELNLCANRIGIAGARALAESAVLGRLRKLQVDGTLGTAAKQALRQRWGGQVYFL
jgi:uncharacterized protein (TIGR02996 family)